MARKEFSADDMRDLLRDLDAELQRIGTAAKIFVVGGSAMALAYKADRKSDGDLADAVHLCRLLGISNQNALESTVRKYFPGGRFGSQELFFERIIDSL